MSYDIIESADERQWLFFRGYNCGLNCLRSALFWSDSFICGYIPPTTLDTSVLWNDFTYKNCKINLSLCWSPCCLYTKTDIKPYIRRPKPAFFLIMYSVSSRESFDVACHQLHALETHNLSLARVILVGSKCDLRSVVDESEEAKVADQFGVPHIRVSSATGFRVKELRDMIGDMFVRESLRDTDNMYDSQNKPEPNNVSSNPAKSWCLVM